MDKLRENGKENPADLASAEYLESEDGRVIRIHCTGLCLYRNWGRFPGGYDTSAISEQQGLAGQYAGNACPGK